MATQKITPLFFKENSFLLSDKPAKSALFISFFALKQLC